MPVGKVNRTAPFSFAERTLIERMLQEGKSYEYIGQQLGCDRVKVAREVKAATPEFNRGSLYSAETAQAFADARYFRQFINARGNPKFPVIEFFKDRNVAATARGDDDEFECLTED